LGGDIGSELSAAGCSDLSRGRIGGEGTRLLNVQRPKRTRAARAPKRMKEELRRVLKPGASILGISSGVLLFDLEVVVADEGATQERSDASDRNECAAKFSWFRIESEMTNWSRVDRGAQGSNMKLCRLAMRKWKKRRRED
jgi:hypothetical protein